MSRTPGDQHGRVADLTISSCNKTLLNKAPEIPQRATLSTLHLWKTIHVPLGTGSPLHPALFARRKSLMRLFQEDRPWGAIVAAEAEAGVAEGRFPEPSAHSFPESVGIPLTPWVSILCPQKVRQTSLSRAPASRLLFSALSPQCLTCVVPSGP